MRRSFFFLGSVALAASGIFACVGDDSTNPAAPPGNDGGAVDATIDAPFPFDSAPPPEAAPDTGPATTGPYLLLTYAFDAFKKSEFAAIDLPTGLRAGGLQFAKFGTNMSTAKSPWVLAQAGDLVMKMDPAAPWNGVGVWSVAEPKGDAGGNDYSDPYAIAETDTKAYVALFNRNVVPVLDTTKLALDAGAAPSTAVDLSSLVQPGDTDGHVETTAAVYDAGRNRVWLVLGDYDLNAVDPNGGFSLCTAGLHATVIAIDVTTDTLVPSLAYPLKGIVPYSVVYDAKNDRLLVGSDGCNQPVADAGADAGPGPLAGRVIEAIDLASGTSQILLDANAQGFPGSLIYVGPHQAYVSFSGVTYAWDPGSPTLGAALGTAPDAYVWDGKGHLVGPKASYLGDGGLGSIDILAVDPADGGVTKLGTNPVTSPDPGGSFEGVDLWPHP
jgi:hypothetical protein